MHFADAFVGLHPTLVWRGPPALNGGNGLAVGLVGAARGDSNFGGDGVGEGHLDAVLGAEDDHGAGLNGLAWGQFEVVLAEERAEDHEDLEHGVVAADAAARASAEGDVGEGRLLRCVGFGEALGVEELLGWASSAGCDGRRRRRR